MNDLRAEERCLILLFCAYTCKIVLLMCLYSSTFGIMKCKSQQKKYIFNFFKINKSNIIILINLYIIFNLINLLDQKCDTMV